MLTAAHPSRVLVSFQPAAVTTPLAHQLDALRRFPNVMVLTTSNITEAIDLAFVDRADIKAYIGPPSLHARCDCVNALTHVIVRYTVRYQESISHQQ